jgi:hypothetical protein
VAIKVNRMNTVDAMAARKPPLCRTCGQRNEGVVTISPYGDPICAKCAGSAGEPVRQPRALRGQDGATPDAS